MSLTSLLDKQVVEAKLSTTTMGGGETNSSSIEEQVVEQVEEEELVDSQNTQREYAGEIEFSKWDSSDYSDSAARETRRLRDFEEIMQSYDSLKLRLPSLEEAKLKLLRYKPGAWAEDVGLLKMDDYDVPKTTTLLLVGLSGSGKSSLVNKILRVFEDDKLSSERAQVSYNNVGDGTLFLREYVVHGSSNSFCLYDTRGFHGDPFDNYEMIKSWMTKGVRHGELVLRKSDSSSQKNSMKCKARKIVCSKQKRTVNFVIFVINALSVLKYMDGEDDDEARELLEISFICPYLSFKDDKPVVVCTHGDLLSPADRARVRIHLGELLGIPPATQIFDIPDNCHPETELAVVDMLTYSLVHADRNLPAKSRFPCEVSDGVLIFLVCLCLLVWIPLLLFEFCHWREIWHSSGNSTNTNTVEKSKMNATVYHDFQPWHEIRHVW